MNYSPDLIQRFLSDFNTDVIKAALYTGATPPTEYTTTNELAATGYPAGGITLPLTVTTQNGGSLGIVNTVPSYLSGSFTVTYALIYNATKNYAVMVLPLGPATVTGGTMEFIWPSPLVQVGS